jgi:hypothetical protein
LKSPNLIDKTAKIEYLKEEVQYWRTLLLGIAGRYVAVLISWASFLIYVNKSEVGGNDAEASILNLMSSIFVGMCSIGLLICPLAEASRKHREAANSFLTIGEKEA